MLEALVTGDGLALALRARRYEFGDVETGDDANWVVGEVEATLHSPSGDAFRARCPVCWTTYELASFRDELARVVAAGRGRASLTTLEDQVELTVELHRGQGWVSGRVEQHAVAALEFENVATTAAELAPGLAGLEAVVARFPPRPRQ